MEIRHPPPRRTQRKHSARAPRMSASLSRWGRELSQRSTTSKAADRTGNARKSATRETSGKRRTTASRRARVTAPTERSEPVTRKPLARRPSAWVPMPSAASNTAPSDRLVDHHVFDPGPHACRDSEDDKRQHTDDSPIVPAVSRYQHRAGLGLDNLADQVWGRHGGTSGQLRYQTVEGGDQLVINSVCCCNLNPAG